MKFTGGVPILLLMIYTGFKIAFRLRKREKILEETVFFLKSLTLDFKYSSLTLKEIIEKYALSGSLKSLVFISDVNKDLNNGIDFPLAWKEKVSAFKNLRECEKEKLISLGELLGTSSVETQISLIEYYKKVFEDYYDKSRNENEKYFETSILVFTFIGVGLFIILI